MSYIFHAYSMIFHAFSIHIPYIFHAYSMIFHAFPIHIPCIFLHIPWTVYGACTEYAFNICALVWVSIGGSPKVARACPRGLIGNLDMSVSDALLGSPPGANWRL